MLTPVERLLEILALLMLAGVGITGLVRSFRLAARGVWVLPIDRERTAVESLADLAFLLGLVFWVYQVVVLGTGPAREPALSWLPLRWLGVVLAGAGFALYVRTLHDFGASWRFSIDRERAGTLVTSGVFARTRNPVYLALLLLAFGVSLALASARLLLLALGAAVYFHWLIRREERFLRQQYGDRYAVYCASVPRWLGRRRRNVP